MSKVKVVVLWTVPEQPRMLESLLLISSPDPPIVREAVVSKVARRRVEAEGTEADHEPEVIPVGGSLSVVDGCESEGVMFEEAVGRAGLISETETALDTAGLAIC